ncbi:movement protein [Watermelon virus A]|uniref:Movement protein n=1 Tax=Watermelon virus A TaxID=1978413 RepID=A0A1W5W6D3_9VIRU|nr:movement protein [Watermelon virus A]ARH01898.1 movement protein [Watermelon virus A]
MASTSMTLVKSLEKRIEADKSLMNSSEVDKLYGNLATHVFKDEVKIKIGGNENGNVVSTQCRLIGASRMQQILNSAQGKKAAYLHIGCIPITIQSLLPSGNSKIKGRCALVDVSRTSLDTGLIDGFTFSFTDEKPYTGRMIIVNKVIDFECDASVGSIQLVLEVEGIDLRIQRSALAVTVGMTCIPSNTAIVFPSLQRSKMTWALTNSVDMKEQEIKEDEQFKELFENTNTNLIDQGETVLLEEKGSMLNLFGTKRKTVARRILKNKGPICRIENWDMGSVKSGPVKMKRSNSLSSASSFESKFDGRFARQSTSGHSRETSS